MTDRDAATAPVLAIDGPGGSGKGTVTRLVALRLGWHLLDSGALYRLLGLAALERGIALDDTDRLAELARRLDVAFVADAGVDESEGETRVLLDGREVGDRIRTEAVGEAASRVAALGPVREGLLDLQRGFRQPPGLVADGRDMGTIVFPEAEVKVFLTASAEERAERRYKQLKDKGLDASLDNLLQEIRARDARDTERAVAPLIAAEDATTIDTTAMPVDEVVARVLSLLQARSLIASS